MDGGTTSPTPRPDATPDQTASSGDTRPPGSADVQPDVAGPSDVAAVDSSPTVMDVGVADLRPSDGRGNDTAAADARDTNLPDVASVDAGPPFQPNPACDYFGASRTILRCPEMTVLSTMVSPRRGPMCPEYKVAHLPSGERAFRTTQEAAAALGCDLTCVYEGPTTSGSLAYCGQSATFDSYRDGGQGQTQPRGACPGLNFYASAVGHGWFENFAAFQKAYPCQPGTTTP